MSEKGKEASPNFPQQPGQFSPLPNGPAPNAPHPSLSLPLPSPAPSSVMSADPNQPVQVSLVGSVSLQDTHYWTVISTGGTGYVSGAAELPQGSVTPAPKVKSLLEAYVLWLPLGILGAHHFYLGRPAFGVMYLFTFGLLGCGWLVDLLRMPCLVSSVNRKNRERHEQLEDLRQQLQQQQLQQEQQYGTAAAAMLRLHHSVAFLPFEPRSLVDAYVLWFPFGLLGFHHFYLRNYGMGVLYFFTFGLVGLGWLVDLFRMPGLVRDANSCRIQSEAKPYSQCTGHVLALSPAGVLGAHHFYLGRPLWGLLYLSTLGLVGAGWIYDWFRISCLVRRSEAVRRGQRSPDRKYVDDAYILCLPFGFTGLHHFYLRRYGWGALYFFTLGLVGVGWLVDWFRLPCLVREYNANLEQSQRLLFGGSGSAAAGSAGMNYSGTANQTQVQGDPAVYSPMAAEYGYNQTPVYPRQGHTAGGYPGYMGQGYAPQAVSPPSYEAAMETDNAAAKN